MHRFLKFSGTHLNSFQRLSFSTFSGNVDKIVTEKTCLLCKHLIISRNQTRTRTTNTNPNLQLNKPKKKRKKSKKIYAELVVVTDNSSCHRKATIQKLTSCDLKLLASTNLDLSELYKLKDFPKNSAIVEEHTYNNLNVIENISSTSTFCQNELINCDSTEQNAISDLVPPCSNINNAEIDPVIQNHPEYQLDNHLESLEEHGVQMHRTKILNTFQPEIIDESISEVEDVKESFEKDENTITSHKYKDEVTAKALAAYIEVCAHLRNPQRGLNALHFYRGRSRITGSKYASPVRNINVYNALLKGFAHKSDFQKIIEILKTMAKENLELNTQSYISIFECLGRINIKDNYLKEIRIYAKEAMSKGITFDRMLNEGTFLGDEREMVLRSFRSYDSSYIPKYNRPIVGYTNHLVKHLNKKYKDMSTDLLYRQNGALFNPNALHKCIEKQIQLEKSGVVTISSIEATGEISTEVLRHRETLEEHYKMWEVAALAAFNRDLSSLAAQRSAINMEPFLRCIPSKDFVLIILEEAKKMAQGSETYSPTVNMLYRELGSKVYARYQVLRKQKTGVLDKLIEIHSNYCTKYAALYPELDVLPEKEVNINPRQLWQLTEYSVVNNGSTLTMDHQKWTPAALQFIGKFLYHIVMHDLKIDVNSLRINSHKNYLPSFYTIFRTQGRIVKEEVKPHPILSKLYRYSMPETLTFPTYELPMLCPPVPWTSTENGGYLVSPCDVVRLPFQATAQKQRLVEAGPQQLYPSLDALNQLAAVPWKVNTKILDVILEVFRTGGSSALDVPEPPSSLQPPPNSTNEMDKAEKYQLFRQKLQHRRKKAEMYSLWCDCLYRLSLANHFRNDIFWLPHNMDFRGRVYPIPPHLNHLGSDLARSMLVFAQSRPLGPRGLDWLKIHLVNLTGLKKRDPVEERLKFANDIMDFVLDSADNPLKGNRWWAQSDEPWQTLACCMEIADVVRSPDPEAFRSHFPVHQDGSCNGLQHYAALGRDSGGAFSVNLTPSDVPQDVYSAVVTLVEEQRFKDAQDGLEIAKVLEGFVKRKVIKQTIMTTVYGVTRFGARLQIARQLKDIHNFPTEFVWSASSYLTTRTFDSLRTMFTSTREIQDWFTECARLISSVGCQHVEWVTPLGLPIVQPYIKQKKSGDIFVMDKYEKPNVMKQKNAFPPNFIHSLDSSHMMLTSLHCERAGITFVSVHDCYWTHPSTVHIMNQICREQFVALHSEPILENLSTFLADKYSYDLDALAGDGSVVDLTKKKLNRILLRLPKTGDFDIKQVLNSVYFFS